MIEAGRGKMLIRFSEVSFSDFVNEMWKLCKDHPNPQNWKFCSGLSVARRSISHTKGRVQNSENKRFHKVFHFYEAPTVTAGFIGFYI